MREISNAVVEFFAAYFIFVAILFPVILAARAFHLSERAEKRLVNTIAWLAFLIPVGGLVVLTLAYYLTPG